MLRRSQSAGKRNVDQKVRPQRTGLGLTQEALAHGADIDTRYVRAIERGEENPSVAVFGRIAEVLEVHPAELLRETATRKSGRSGWSQGFPSARRQLLAGHSAMRMMLRAEFSDSADHRTTG